MNSPLLSAAVRTLRSTADYMISLGNILDASENPQQVVEVSNLLETEIERIRVMVLLLRHDAQCSGGQPVPAPTPAAVAPAPTQPPTPGVA